MMEDVEEITLSIDDVYDLVDNLEKDLLKSEDVTWEQEQKVSESAEKIDDILSEIEEISEMIEEIQEEADNNELFNEDLINKFNEFQELLDQIITDEMLETLKKWLDKNRPGDFNEALMELGACICTPKKPKCSGCPIKALCIAHKSGNPLNYPNYKKNKSIPNYTLSLIHI